MSSSITGAVHGPVFEMNDLGQIECLNKRGKNNSSGRYAGSFKYGSRKSQTVWKTFNGTFSDVRTRWMEWQQRELGKRSAKEPAGSERAATPSGEKNSNDCKEDALEMIVTDRPGKLYLLKWTFGKQVKNIRLYADGDKAMTMAGDMNELSKLTDGDGEFDVDELEVVW